MTTTDTRIRVFLFIAGLLLGAEAMQPRTVLNTRPAIDGETLDAAVRRNVANILFERRGIKVQTPETDVCWVNAPEGGLELAHTLTDQTFVVLGIPPHSDENRDLYRVTARVTPFGMTFDDSWIVNLTRTVQADDSLLVSNGNQVATVVFYSGAPTAIEVRDFLGEDPNRVGTDTWGLLRRIGNWVTNLEQTGQIVGIGLDYYALDGSADVRASDLRLSIQNDLLTLWSNAQESPLVSIDLNSHATDGRIRVAHLPPVRKMKYDFLNWLADRGRGFANQGIAPNWAGSSIEMMKEVYFKAQEVKADIAEVAPVGEAVQVEAPEVVEEAIRRAKLQVSASNLPWPPPPIEPLLEDRIQGEGIWQEVPADVATRQPNAPVPFYTTFLRPDPDYRRKRVWIVVWDPAQVSLKMRAGTTNPVPQTGHRGDGRIPREQETLKRVVAGFNGGFQTSHIWYGMMVDRKVLLRPREYGATAGSWADGRTAFGTWPPSAPIPSELTHYRQNLPPLIEDGVFNPYRRRTWGWHKNVAGAVHGMTTRSSLCYTYDGFVMYLYSEFQNEHGLANTLFHVGCRYAIHLDMNKGHTGFEFYKYLPEGVAVLNDEHAEVEGLTFRGTSLHPTIRHMKAPTRYLGVDYRDFFYLELRDVMPGPDLHVTAANTPATDADGKWSTIGIRHNSEFPPRITWAEINTSTIPVPQAIPFTEGPTMRDTMDSRIDVFQVDLESVAISQTSGPIPMTEELMLTLPIPANFTGTQPITLGSQTLSGIPLGTGNETSTNAIVIARDGDARGWFLVLRNSTTGRARQLLIERGIDNAIVMPLKRHRASLTYQQTLENNEELVWIEAEVGAIDGNVLTTLTDDGARIVLARKQRPDRIIRMFPDMRPKPRKTRKR